MPRQLWLLRPRPFLWIGVRLWQKRFLVVSQSVGSRFSGGLSVIRPPPIQSRGCQIYWLNTRNTLSGAFLMIFAAVPPHTGGDRHRVYEQKCLAGELPGGGWDGIVLLVMSLEVAPVVFSGDMTCWFGMILLNRTSRRDDIRINGWLEFPVGDPADWMELYLEF